MLTIDPRFGQLLDEESPFGEAIVEETAPLTEMEPGTSEPTQRAEDEVESPTEARAAVALLPVSGSYEGSWDRFHLTLRVDIDRKRPMKRVSGDVYQTSGRTTIYSYSLVVNSPTVTVTASLVTIRGRAEFSIPFNAVVQVTIPRRTTSQPQAPATVQFFALDGTPYPDVYTCAFESIYFRSVRIEIDQVSDVTTPVFGSYNTGSLPSGGPARNLSVVSAYAEAGIRMIPTGDGDVINIGEAGPDAVWSDAELHASMLRHFALWQDRPQWFVVARLHELGSSLYGIMFDQQGRQRQGCAVFHEGIGGTSAAKLRLQLYTYVHELGHCFNLLHSWQKRYASPPVRTAPTPCRG